jgi:Uma2 family endonuclease
MVMLGKRRVAVENEQNNHRGITEQRSGPCHFPIIGKTIRNRHRTIEFQRRRPPGSPNPLAIGERPTMPTIRTPKRRPKPTKLSSPSPFATDVTIADLLKRLGNIPANRVRLHPMPGTATEKDLLAVLDHENRPCELVEGTLVEKPMGIDESRIAGIIITHLNSYVLPRKLGIVTAPDGPIQLFAGLIRIPDVAFASWNCFPDRKMPKTPIPHVAPDLAVEVLSKSNTKPEMTRKVSEYFKAGVKLVWLVDPKKKTVRVYTAVDQFVQLHEGQKLDGGDVLPGFSMPITEVFTLSEPD